MMKLKTKKTIPLATLVALLVGCAGHKPQGASVKPAVQPKLPAYSMALPPPKLPGEWTVEDVLADFGDYAARKMRPYFAKAKVAYPPRGVVLLALKEEKKLELWASDGGGYRFIRNYDIQAASGKAGPKLRQGDRQVPEGVYRVVGLNPNSNYHLSMKLDYPNGFDLLHADEEGRYDPGGDIFIHGRAASIGCLAMGDETIEELFVLAAEVGKENVKVVIAPRDPRISPLDAQEFDGLPEWTPELYEMISIEVEALSPPVNLSKRGPLPQAPEPKP
jgi:hypothetical protein